GRKPAASKYRVQRNPVRPAMRKCPAASLAVRKELWAQEAATRTSASGLPVDFCTVSPSMVTCAQAAEESSSTNRNRGMTLFPRTTHGDAQRAGALAAHLEAVLAIHAAEFHGIQMRARGRVGTCVRFVDIREEMRQHELAVSAGMHIDVAGPALQLNPERRGGTPGLELDDAGHILCGQESEIHAAHVLG